MKTHKHKQQDLSKRTVIIILIAIILFHLIINFIIVSDNKAPKVIE